MTREARFVVIGTIILAVGVGGFYVLARQLRYGLTERPYIANIKQQLRALAAAQSAYHAEHQTYANDAIRVWVPPSDNSAQGISLRILAADSTAYAAEGRSAGWEGHCVVAVGRLAGDSLPPGEPVCSRD